MKKRFIAKLEPFIVHTRPSWHGEKVSDCSCDSCGFNFYFYSKLFLFNNKKTDKNKKRGVVANKSPNSKFRLSQMNVLCGKKRKAAFIP